VVSNGTIAIASPLTFAAGGTTVSAELILAGAQVGDTGVVEIRLGPNLPGTVVASGMITATSTALTSYTIPLTSTALVPGGAYYVSVRAVSGSISIARSTATGFQSSSSPTLAVWFGAPAANSIYARVLGTIAGACCSPISTACVVLSSADCAGFGGTFLGNASVCGSTPCLALGACCQSGACTLTTQLGCLIAQIGQPQGRWLGVGTACTPAGVPNACCPADFNGSGTRDVADIFAFLSSWFAGCP
ncbi:MAG: hypothetical protein K2Q20_13030, partial [Phycisphaerales bacterium]|nr:hypothetical protein [Phycisphaerales bacterium]